MLALCQNSYFQNNGGFSRQRYGCAVVLPVFSIFADLYIKEVEGRGLNSLKETAPLV